MLELVVEAAGNTGGRFFPTTGHFGITPVQIAGTIITRLPPLAPPLPVSDVFASIKCIETRLVGGTVERVLWEKRKRIWSSPDYVDFADWTHPFRISIPTDVAAKTASAQTLKEWKTVWRFEIAVKHRPIQYVGDHVVKSFYLNILNHATPPITPPSPLTDLAIGADAYAAVVNIEPPHGVYGPEASLPLTIRAKPVDPEAVVKKVHVVLERVLEFLEDSSPSPPKSLFRRSSPSKDTPAEIQQIESVSTDEFELEDGASRFQTSIALARRTRWDMGETVRTKLLSMRFQLRVKVTIKPAKSKTSRDFSCPPIPVTLCAVTAAELARARVVAPVAALKQPAQRKARSSRRGLYMHEGTVDIATDAALVSPPPVSRKRSISPFVPTKHAGLKPILISPDHPTQPVPPQSIQFIFPSPPPHSSYLSPDGLPPISSIFPPINAPSPPSYESWSIIKRFQATGRRISTTGSEEEAMQPSRSRQRLEDELFDGRPSLPSLDALGLGLPHVARSPARRPMTAPAFSAPFGSSSSLRQMSDATTTKSPTVAFGQPPQPRPRTSLGAVMKSPYPQDDPHASRPGEMSSTPFAFTVKKSDNDD